MAAGDGTRLRPLTERWPKPILPIDGRPVIVMLLHELAFCERIVVVRPPASTTRPGAAVGGGG